jgi:hypothetical protein
MKVEDRSQDSSVTIVTMLHAKNYLKFDSEERQQIFLFSKASTLALRPTLPPIQWISAVLSLRVKQIGCDTHHVTSV